MKTYEEKIPKKTITKNRLEIRQDENPFSPRDYSHLGYFITAENRYNSPDDNPTIETIIRNTGKIANDLYNHIELVTERIKELLDENVVEIYPITRYEHGMVKYMLGNYGGWDYSLCGFYIVTDKTQKEIGIQKENFKKVIQDEINDYNCYVNGEIYNFVLKDKKGEIVDSCGGFYDLKSIKEQLSKEWQDEDLSDYVISY